MAPGAGFTTACAPKTSGSVGELVKLKPTYDKKTTTTVYATRRRPVHFISRPTHYTGPIADRRRDGRFEAGSVKNQQKIKLRGLDVTKISCGHLFSSRLRERGQRGPARQEAVKMGSLAQLVRSAASYERVLLPSDTDTHV